MIDLTDKSAIVTGAAGGIGRATVEVLVTQGARVLMVDRDASHLEAFANSFPKDTVAHQVADVADPIDIESYVSRCVELFGGVDIAVFSAGVTNRFVPLADLSVKEFDHVIGVNLRGPWLGLKQVMPLMAEQKNGSVIMISSTAGVEGASLESFYTASKHGLIGLMKTACLEYSPNGVRCNCILPGPIDTPMLNSAMEELDEPEAGRDLLAQGTALKRLGRPEEVARLIAFLASDDASFITGASYAVDGGFLAGVSY